MQDKSGAIDLFNTFKQNILNSDPVYFCENFLTLDGKPFQLNGNGYKPFADIYRYVALKAVLPDSRGVVLVKGRQVGATTMAAALELYFMACGLYGTNNRSSMAIMHLFPTLSLAAAYTKDKLDSLISTSKPMPGIMKNNGMLKSFMETKLESSDQAGNNQHYKRFVNNNKIWIESTGLDGDRVRGRKLNLETELPTPNRGFIKLKDLKEGDKLFDENGDVCTCVKLHPIQESPESYRVTFDDGTTIDACAEHLWLTYTKKDRNVNARNNYKMKRRELRRSQGAEYKSFLERPDLKPNPTVKTTKQILETLMRGNEYNHSIPVIPYVKYPEKELLIHPYILGLWLGDGTSNGGCISSADPEVFEGFDHHLIPSSVDFYNPKCFSKDGYCKSRNYRIPGLTHNLRKLGLINNKHIPEVYMQSSYEQRLALLQGLMDTDGCCYNGDGRCEFVQIVDRERLAFQVKELASSLGIKCRITKKESFRYDIQYKDKYQILFSTNKPVFRLKRKLANQNQKESTKKSHRFIRSIEPINPVPMRCITVDSPSHLYLVTRSFIATHNTVDAIFYDECFPYEQKIELEKNQTIAIGEIFDLYTQNKSLPLVKTYNEQTKQIEFKKIIKAWKRDKKQLVELTFESSFNGIISIKCTDDHRFLIGKEKESWVKAKNIRRGDSAIIVQKDKIGLASFIKGKETNEFVEVYDISVEDNHNFIVNELIAHNCQDMNDVAIGTAAKILTQAKYGPKGNGVQVFFGTPKTKGGSYWKTWQNSTQNYFHLRCEKCGEYFPLYRPDINWEDVWLYGMTVRCTQCKHEQEKNQAAENGKWIPIAKNPDSCDFVGYHINQLYIPFFTKEVIEKQKPERNPSNSERLYMNEVLGEFFDGDGSTLSVEEIHNKCADRNRYMSRTISPEKNKKVYVGFDWGQKALLDQTSGRRQGKSYSCAVVLTSPAPNIFEVEFATRLMRNDPEEKMNVVEEMFRRYSVALSVGDIGDAFDLTHKLQRKYGDVFLASRSSHRVNGHVKYSEEEFPKVIMFEKDYYISEMIGLLKEGRIKFPYKDYEKIDWLIKHCASMDIKITRDKTGEPMKKYIKGDGPNDGLMALLNAYLAWKFDVTQGFKIKNPSQMKYEKATQCKTVGAILGYVPGLSRG